MDANGARFHLLLGRDDWGRCTSKGRLLSEAWSEASGADVAWDSTRAEVSLRAELFRFIAAPRDVPPVLEDRRGAAKDRYGNVYWAARDGRTLKVLSSGSRQTSDFWPVTPEAPPVSGTGGFGPLVPPTPPTPELLAGMAISGHHYLVAGTVAPAGLLVFDLHSGGPPVRHVWPMGVPFAPWDMAATPDGGVVVLDRQHRRLWRLDAGFRVVRTGVDDVLSASRVESFQPLAGGPTRTIPAVTFPRPVTLDSSTPVAAQDPISVEVLPDGRVLVLDRGTNDSRLLVYRDGVLEGAPVPLEVDGLLGDTSPSSSYVLVAHDMALLPAESDGSVGRVVVVGRDGNQAFAFELLATEAGPLVAVAQPEYLPLRLFGGKALIASDGQALYDFADTFIPLVAQRRPRYVAEGTLRTPVLDGRTPDCVWHRLLLDASLPPGARLVVRSRAANERSDLEALPFSEEPTLHKRGDGSELPFTTTAKGEHRGTFEVLFQRAKGRYAQVELTLLGGGAATPRVHAMRAWYPRFSYAEQYLPGLYRQDPESASFLDRFLANPEGLLTPLEDRIAAAQVLFDARSAPPEALEWLASWFGVALDPAWDETRRRLFLRHTLDFFQWRGTPRGLRMALRVALDDCPDDSIFTDDTEPTRARYRIVERFRSARTPFLFATDASETGGIRIQPAATSRRWEPSQGIARLLERYQATLVDAGVTAPVDALPLREPTQEAIATVWRAFMQEALGFIPAATVASAPRWLDFLTRRYRTVQALNAAHGTTLTDFTQATLPVTLPGDGPAQSDWYHFETVVLPVRAAAHRFTVVLPVPRGSAAQEQRARQEQAMRVVAVEKPAHTVFDVKFYWDMFRVGEARLGVDTLVDLGSRAPELMPAMRLGREYLAESHLAPRPPQDAADRRILGRDLLGRRETHGSDIQ
ncbi:phage tail protein [Myxococcus qinghaiensis]|uniref:phage tail protein n=1 Tax=Myxococcus qinghaiensis TaxID=2906758 RepID=UPI0020A6EA82|nr:phage tail protein [Myxococcus qinghaiensis]MCP3169242.1 phage tail protein [Myxococcus qinghaiensis]